MTDLAALRAARRSDAVACARAWIGTPYVTGAALRGAGADCIGLIEGVAAELTGRPRGERPPWRADWASVTDLAAVAASAGFAVIDAADARPGDVLALRLTRGAPPHHLAIMTAPDRVAHAVEGRAVVETHLSFMAQRVALAAVFPLE